MKGRVDIISNDKMIVSELIPFYRKEYFDIKVFNNQKEGITAILNEEFNLIILDIDAIEQEPLSIIKLIRKNKPNLPIILLASSTFKKEKILEMLKVGAFHYFLKENLLIEEVIIYSNFAIEIHNLKKEYAVIIQEILQKEEQKDVLDEKTGLLSYAGFLQHMKQAERKSSKAALPISIIFSGIYNYDEILSKEGEIFISQLLSQVSVKIARNLRSSDIKGYYENGIFAIGIESGDIACALHVAEKISKIIKENNFKIGDEEVKIHLNSGAASLVLGTQYDLDYLINAALQSYYKASKNAPGWIELYSEKNEI